MDFDNKLKPKVENVSLFPKQEQAPKKNDLKATFQDRFSKLYPNKRLLAVQLNGFNHTIFADDGTGEGEVEIIRHNPNAPEQGQLTPESTKFFEGYPTYQYQGNPKEILYVHPNKRKVK